jgi:hypothetical protein
MLTDSINLMALSEVELDRLIGELIRVPYTDRTVQSENLGQSASAEWQRRYPDTVCPSFYAYVMERGGFKECYRGPQETVELTTPELNHQKEDNYEE